MSHKMQHAFCCFYVVSTGSASMDVSDRTTLASFSIKTRRAGRDLAAIE